MDIELLEKALENDDNLSIINTNIQDIKKKKNDILQQLGLERDNLKTFHTKLKGYRYIDTIKEFKYGSVIRWINLNKLDEIKLQGAAFLSDIKIHDKGIALILRAFGGRYFTIYFNENLIFQKINNEEEVLLKAINYLNK
jgi:hypothetical protein